jgi:hypothetical protein
MNVSRTCRAVVSVVALVAGGLLTFAAPASAATQVAAVAPVFTGSVHPGVTYDTTAVCDTCYPDLFGPGSGSWAFGAAVTSEVSGLSYAPASNVTMTYDDSLLRQGQTLAVSNKLTPLIGTMTATGHLNMQYGSFRDPAGGTDFVPAGTLTAADKPFTLSMLCSMPLPGDAPTTCSSGAIDIPFASIVVIPQILLSPGLTINLSVRVSLTATINGDGDATERSLQVVGGGAPLTAPLSFGGTSPSTVADSVHLSCAQPAGNNVQYALTHLAYTPTIDLAATTAVHFEATITDVVDTDIFGGDLGSITSAAAGISMPMTAPDQVVDLGPLAKNNIPPTVDAGNGGSYSGSEGHPVAFDGGGSSSVCGFPTLRWDFSDGGVAFGAHPVHTFTGAGLYSGQLTATDTTGLTSATTFSADITNLPPAVDAGPNVGAAWGIPVALNGSATDPGTDDQSTLAYRWDFGDGTPSATGGPHVSHAYSTPGNYTATFRACDRYAACNTNTTSVAIRKRSVAASYLGDFAGTYLTAGSASASLTDEFGRPVQGRTVTFSYNGVAIGDASTNSSGIASRSFTPMLDAGTYPISAAFAGDSLYTSAANTGAYTEAVKATVVTYTGALNGAPNKIVSLSAVLKDATGLPMGGRTITFKLGTQTAAAVTNASGVATTTLKLTQKNGKYPLTATYAPSGTDTNRYAGASAAVTFSLQAK